MISGAAPAIVRRYRGGEDAEATYTAFRSAITQTASADYTPAQIAAWLGPEHPEHPDLSAWDARRRAAHTFVAVVGERVAGFTDFLDDGTLDMLFVHPEFGGHGISRLLVDTVVGEARQAGLATLRTYASRTAKPVFERFGFRLVAARPHNVVRGETVPNYEMYFELTTGRR